MNGCAVSGCEDWPKYSLGIRCRKPNTHALWAPNAPLGLCERHAKHGLVVRLEVEPAPKLGGIVIDVGAASRFVAFSEKVTQ